MPKEGEDAGRKKTQQEQPPAANEEPEAQPRAIDAFLVDRRPEVVEKLESRDLRVRVPHHESLMSESEEDENERSLRPPPVPGTENVVKPSSTKASQPVRDKHFVRIGFMNFF
jgi:hypothetical protein